MLTDIILFVNYSHAQQIRSVSKLKGACPPFLFSGAKDWDWLYDVVPDKLKELDGDGYRVMFYTNQAGIEKQKVKPQEIMTKIEAIIEKLDIPVLVSEHINKT